ncbi:class II aldolase/adducin family protein [Schaalia sp. 19OD2882]|uniref:class II aldolase/adducin family protein n=1 Tax=Schaalia sp. 19OD2882 TaxID=2794089 RepID=UPI001C1EC17A|nr:class II aldolase/adducin family protein [Schaalia sp. 19OD2882]QWW20195.1 class II aldolase/adducin family protein [Schaalia sp. 19OD2882]
MFNRAHLPLAFEILYYCQKSMEYGLNFNTQGNISARIPGTDLVMVTPSDIEYDRMSATDMVIVDMDGAVHSGSHAPSSEIDVHLATYERRPDAQAIVHAEPVFANAFGVAGTPIAGSMVNMIIYTKGEVPIMPFQQSNSREFGEAMCDVMGDLNAVVWANHGILTVGPDLRTAFKTAVAVESAAKILWAAKAISSDLSLLSYDELGLDHAL